MENTGLMQLLNGFSHLHDDIKGPGFRDAALAVTAETLKQCLSGGKSLGEDHFIGFIFPARNFKEMLGLPDAGDGQFFQMKDQLGLRLDIPIFLVGLTDAFCPIASDLFLSFCLIQHLFQYDERPASGLSKKSDFFVSPWRCIDDPDARDPPVRLPGIVMPGATARIVCTGIGSRGARICGDIGGRMLFRRGGIAVLSFGHIRWHLVKKVPPESKGAGTKMAGPLA